jgi:hypothetical protein
MEHQIIYDATENQLRGIIDQMLTEIEELKRQVAYLQEQIDNPDWKDRR